MTLLKNIIKESIKDSNELMDLFKKRKEIIEQQEKLHKERLKIGSEISTKLLSLGVQPGDCACDNPLGVCIYSCWDEYRDCCLHCGQPEERK